MSCDIGYIAAIAIVGILITFKPLISSLNSEERLTLISYLDLSTTEEAPDSEKEIDDIEEKYSKLRTVDINDNTLNSESLRHRLLHSTPYDCYIELVIPPPELSLIS